MHKIVKNVVKNLAPPWVSSAAVEEGLTVLLVGSNGTYLLVCGNRHTPDKNHSLSGHVTSM